MIVKHSLPSIVLSLTLIAAAGASAQDADADKVKALLKDDPIVNNSRATYGRIAESSVFFARECTSTSGGRLLLIKAQEASWPIIWEGPTTCIRNVSWRDIDGDGAPEIRVHSGLAGSGVVATYAIFYRWDDGADAPEEIISFHESGYTSWGGFFNSYGFDAGDYIDVTIYTDNFLPVGATCATADTCELVERTVFCVEDCNMELPEGLTSRPGWQDFLVAAEADGIKSGHASASAEVQEVTKEAQAAFDAWLSD